MLMNVGYLYLLMYLSAWVYNSGPEQRERVCYLQYNCVLPSEQSMNSHFHLIAKTTRWFSSSTFSIISLLCQTEVGCHLRHFDVSRFICPSLNAPPSASPWDWPCLWGFHEVMLIKQIWCLHRQIRPLAAAVMFPPLRVWVESRDTNYSEDLHFLISSLP